RERRADRLLLAAPECVVAEHLAQELLRVGEHRSGGCSEGQAGHGARMMPQGAQRGPRGFVRCGQESPVLAAACILAAAATPVMELIPFGASLAGVAITAFGLALIARDGAIAIVAIVAIAVCIAMIGFVAYRLSVTFGACTRRPAPEIHAAAALKADHVV